MKLNKLTFDDDENPETVTVTMTVAEAAAIAAVFGKFNYYALNRLGISDDRGIYGCLSGLFNSWYEDGIHDVLRLHCDLADLNIPPVAP